MNKYTYLRGVSMKKKVFVDGLSGTTGLKIHERLSLYSELEMITIDYENRRDPKERARCLNEADIVFLCLPDEAAKEAVSLVTNSTTKIIDASTAFRTAKDWTYGLPELSMKHREAVMGCKRLSNPGCHATAFILSAYPLVQRGIIAPDYPITCQSLTGYSGGGKALIEKYESNDGQNNYAKAPRPYALSLNHKHLPEMMVHTGLSEAPLFVPILGNNYKGMAVMLPLHTKLLSKKLNAKNVHEVLEEHYSNEKFVKVMPYVDDTLLYDGAVDITACNDTNNAEIFVFGNEAKGTVVVLTRIDNLGKGASGAAIQNMNIMLGFEEDLHL
jgi:N-acetyl-gamma-glutamyl-phosphate reductase